ncbi:hypothetical protein [Ruegeria halocynthiae]|uniref:hypothetical protein n=1 Tax=Ruegeria halocynthiae TaxID=985054 RepID=UPI000563A7C8|nr:hypothetical protein [Ruegeria halocynthiae]
MTLSDLAKALMLLSLLAIAAPTAAVAKPNSYPGENSKFKTTDPVEIAKQKAERAKRIELRKERRKQRRLERLKRKNNRSN